MKFSKQEKSSLICGFIVGALVINLVTLYFGEPVHHAAIGVIGFGCSVAYSVASVRGYFNEKGE